MFRIILIIFSFLLLYGCYDQEIDKVKIDKEIEYKLYIDKRNKTEECRLKVMLEAEMDVDSVISDLTRIYIGNDSTFPQRPNRDTSKDLYNVKIDEINLKSLKDSIFISND